jgi:hypothetical protein
MGVDFDKKIVTPEVVTSFFELRTKLWTCTCQEDLDKVAYSLGLSYGLEKKRILQAFQERHFPYSANNGEHFKKMRNCAKNLKDFFLQTTEDTSVFVFGSYSIGTINGRHSDLDYLIGLGSSPQDLVAFEQLSQAGIIHSPKLSQIKELYNIIDTGTGLGRIYAVSNDGVEVEFHILGSEDMRQMHKLKPGFVERIIPVNSKNEARASFKGQVANLPKNETIVKHYFQDSENFYSGFFPDAMIMSSLVCDPKGKGQETLDQVWFASVKAYLYHTGFLRKNENRVEIKNRGINFDEFLSTVMPPTKIFTPERYQCLLNQFDKAVSQIITRYNCCLI